MFRYARTLRSLNTLRNNPTRSINKTVRKLSTSDASNTASTSSTNNLDNKNSSFGRNVVNIAAIVGLAGCSFITIYKINKLGDEIGVIKEDIGVIKEDIGVIKENIGLTKGYLFAGSGERLKTEQTATANIDQTEAKEPWFKFFNL